MSWYLCGVFNGPITGQIQTLNAIKLILKDNCDLKIINMPSKGILFPFKWMLYIAFNLIRLFKKDDRKFYIIINRTRLSFWLRDFPIFLMARFKNAHLVCHLVGSDIESFVNTLNFIEKYIISICLRSVDKWIVLGRNTENQIINIYKYLNIRKKFKIAIAEGFISEDLSDYVTEDIIRSKVSSFDKPLNIGYMSNLIEEKGIVIFIETIIYLKEHLGLEVSAWIAGDYIGKPTKKVVEAMNKIKPKKYIKYLGLIRGKQKWDSLIGSEIFILPTYYKTEALPLSIVEAMRCGCLCISSDIGEIDNLLSDNRGIVINKVETQNLARSIEACFKDMNKLKPKINNAVLYSKKEFSFTSYKRKILNALH
jgi:glycosyltransferase involved in cell wall biosynthesis